METETIQIDSPDTEQGQPELPTEPAPAVTNRFLFVDIAALRAKQLRRGARPRIEQTHDHHPLPKKAERVAMEEVKSQKVYFDVPPNKPPSAEPNA